MESQKERRCDGLPSPLPISDLESTPGLDGRARVIIENVRPRVDGGRFPIKRTVGESVEVTADIFADGHDLLSARVRYRHCEDENWTEAPLKSLANDEWRGSFKVTRLGRWQYTVAGWVNVFRSWQRDAEKKFAAKMDLTVEIQTGRELLSKAARFAPADSESEIARILEATSKESDLPVSAKMSLLLGSELAVLMDEAYPKEHIATYGQELEVVVDRRLARFSAWYEFFPRSTASEPGRHGTLKDCVAWLERIAAMGFDIAYLPPIHPIGSAFRKGRNNSLRVAPGDPGSPWAIGSEVGGHKAIHPELGTLEDFRELICLAQELGIHIALDIAFQCSPNHPYVREHPEWFKHRPDGSIQYAENPPKKYQDIYPLNFESHNWKGLWQELKSVFEFWIDRGVTVFRVDNPHTKSFRFWEWCISELKRTHPELIFLSEAFTRPKLMYHLAKLGFTQSYNYFPWRNSKHELTEYFTELSQNGVREFFRPNLWPNTPDILTDYIQYGGHPACVTRLVLAATLGASYGIYGPPLERCETKSRESGSEEYLDSEKYEIRHWAATEGEPIRDLMARLNAIRRENEALQFDDSLTFHEIDNEQLIAYSKHTRDGRNIVLVIVNLDPRHLHRGWLRINYRAWGIEPTGSVQAHELLTNERYIWSGERQFVELNPAFVPAHVFVLRRYVRTERDFDYFL